MVTLSIMRVIFLLRKLKLIIFIIMEMTKLVLVMLTALLNLFISIASGQINFMGCSAWQIGRQKKPDVQEPINNQSIDENDFRAFF